MLVPVTSPVSIRDVFWGRIVIAKRKEGVSVKGRADAHKYNSYGSISCIRFEGVISALCSQGHPFVFTCANIATFLLLTKKRFDFSSVKISI